MSVLGQRALRHAISQLGVTEVPLGSNRGPKVQEYQATTWLPGTGWPWCAAFANWCYKKAGYVFPDRSAGAWDLVNRAVKNGWGVEVSPRKGQKGDLVSWRTGAGHISLWEAYDPVGKLVHTVDGNVQHRVIRCIRHENLVYRIVRVKIDVQTKPLRQPVFEVVTSASGTRQVVATAASLDALIRKLRKLKRQPT